VAPAEGDPTRGLREGLDCADLVGRSLAVARVLQQLRMLAPLDVTVVLTGPSGSGKTQLARLLHRNGRRPNGPFVAVNCAAIPETLAESELFGAEAGAHSTAARRVAGKVEVAQGGTLLLDELGELPLGVQAKLLEFLQSGEFWPLGAAKPRRFEGRVLAATNVCLDAAVAAKRFRADLFYRLSVMTVRLPGLDERREDIPDLLDHFIRESARRHRLPVTGAEPAAASMALVSAWPGHVRQLAHACERATIHAASAGRELVTVADLLEPEPSGVGDQAAQQPGTLYREATRRFQRELVTRTLAQTGGNVTAAAGRLGLTRTHVHALLRSFEGDSA